MEMPSCQLWALSPLSSKAYGYKAPWADTHSICGICGQGFGAASEVLWGRGWELSRNWGVLAGIFIFKFYCEKLNMDEVNSETNCGILKAEIGRCPLEVLTQAHRQTKEGIRDCWWILVTLYQLLRHKYTGPVSLGSQVSSSSCLWISPSFP